MITSSVKLSAAKTRKTLLEAAAVCARASKTFDRASLLEQAAECKKVADFIKQKHSL